MTATIPFPIEGYPCFLGQVKSLTLTGTTQLTDEDGAILFVDPAGGARDLELPDAKDGRFLYIKNTADASETITVKTADGVTTVQSLAQNRYCMLWCEGTTWRSSGALTFA